MFQTLNLVCDNSTLANFKSWAQAISSWFAATGWVKSSDTGQADWSTIASVPGSNSYVYEVWEPNDGLTNFFLKVEYGNSNSTNTPAVRLTVCTATNGAGTPTGDVMGPYTTVPQTNANAGSATNLYPCYFSGEAGRVSILMWRGVPNNLAQVVAVERSVNASGAYTGAHVTLMTAGVVGNNTANSSYSQQTLLFGVGVAPGQSNQQTTGTYGGLAVRWFRPGDGGLSSDFNGSVPFDTTAPMIGYFDYPLTSLGLGNNANYTEGQIFTTTLYGSTHTYVATNSGALGHCGPQNGNAFPFLCVRYE